MKVIRSFDKQGGYGRYVVLPWSAHFATESCQGQSLNI
jgi:hypothetical protein